MASSVPYSISVPSSTTTTIITISSSITLHRLGLLVAGGRGLHSNNTVMPFAVAVGFANGRFSRTEKKRVPGLSEGEGEGGSIHEWGSLPNPTVATHLVSSRFDVANSWRVTRGLARVLGCSNLLQISQMPLARHWGKALSPNRVVNLGRGVSGGAQRREETLI
ncbi:hypothetical protein B9Z19DRAFT_1065060 [Tuber borchii]|uniref:Uncharacterized protein n=1 Tax=Tuber borchii TaxID=42251 RepID=A0A2T6ZSG7_TUBBO|nr:hypothetical protein B9Z19DRAFT_1065060 [Tuber borchii]